jgi:hypothetical protein
MYFKLQKLTSQNLIN